MTITEHDHVVVTGGSGFLGSHLMPVLRHRYPRARITGLSSADCDLLNPFETERMFGEQQPTVVIHLAAYSGGIGSNNAYPADYFHRNLILMENVFHQAALHKVRKLLYPMGGCSYPGDAMSPIAEEQMWNGMPALSSAGYSMAKKMGLIASWAYRKQYDLNSTVVVPGNMYGEYDNYSRDDSHVIPGLIRRFYEAKRDSLKSVTMWGTGNPTRDFVYAGDVAATFPFFLEQDDLPGPINISSGTCTRIRDLAETVARLIGFKGELLWDTGKPDGQLHKIFAVTKLESMGLTCSTTIEEGLRCTIAWFVGNVDKPKAVRL